MKIETLYESQTDTGIPIFQHYTLSVSVNEITKKISSKEGNIVHFHNITEVNMYMSLQLTCPLQQKVNLVGGSFE